MTAKKTVNDLSNEDKLWVLEKWLSGDGECKGSECPFSTSNNSEEVFCNLLTEFSEFSELAGDYCRPIITAAARQITAPLHEVKSKIADNIQHVLLDKTDTECEKCEAMIVENGRLLSEKANQSKSIERLAESIEQRDEIIDRQRCREHVTNRMIVELNIEIDRLREGVE